MGTKKGQRRKTARRAYEPQPMTIILSSKRRKQSLREIVGRFIHPSLVYMKPKKTEPFKDLRRWWVK